MTGMNHFPLSRRRAMAAIFKQGPPMEVETLGRPSARTGRGPAESTLPTNHCGEALAVAASTSFWIIGGMDQIILSFLATTAGQRRDDEVIAEDLAESQQSFMNEPP